mmetsp:Transcript_79456/g.246591  ORF Transcript_79456/g.246591 Transcript_79456/m.246591 type:complete len:542 (-) Transcript_79456:1229-2854(-)
MHLPREARLAPARGHRQGLEELDRSREVEDVAQQAAEEVRAEDLARGKARVVEELRAVGQLARPAVPRHAAEAEGLDDVPENVEAPHEVREDLDDPLHQHVPLPGHQPHHLFAVLGLPPLRPHLVVQAPRGVPAARVLDEVHGVRAAEVVDGEGPVPSLSVGEEALDHARERHDLVVREQGVLLAGVPLATEHDHGLGLLHAGLQEVLDLQQEAAEEGAALALEGGHERVRRLALRDHDDRHNGGLVGLPHRVQEGGHLLPGGARVAEDQQHYVGAAPVEVLQLRGHLGLVLRRRKLAVALGHAQVPVDVGGPVALGEDAGVGADGREDRAPVLGRVGEGQAVAELPADGHHHLVAQQDALALAVVHREAAERRARQLRCNQEHGAVGRLVDLRGDLVERPALKLAIDDEAVDLLLQAARVLHLPVLGARLLLGPVEVELVDELVLRRDLQQPRQERHEALDPHGVHEDAHLQLVDREALLPHEAELHGAPLALGLEQHQPQPEMGADALHLQRPKDVLVVLLLAVRAVDAWDDEGHAGVA